jgi:branched-chain amino acid transport system ATP-binding protein
MALLSVSNVRKSFSDFRALDGVSFGIEKGEFVSIIGPNGAGKTTLVNVITGSLRPNEGQVSFKGQNITAVGPEKLARLGIARSFQLVNIFPNFTVLEFLELAVLSRLGKGRVFYSSLDSDKHVKKQALEIAGQFGLQEKRNTQAKHLPQGDKKLLDVASAFALHPEVILLDEPTSGVSTSDKNRIMEILVSASREMGVQSIIQVEHDMDLVFSYSSRIIALHQGKILADNTPGEILKDENVLCTVVGQKDCFQTFRSMLDADSPDGERP